MPTLLRISVLIGFLLAGAGPAAFAMAADTAPAIDQVRLELQPLRFAAEPTPSEAVRAYWRFYGLDLPGVRHLFGAFRSNGRNLAVQIFVPPSPTATVVLVHGYYDQLMNEAEPVRADAVRRVLEAVESPLPPQAP